MIIEEAKISITQIKYHMVNLHSKLFSGSCAPLYNYIMEIFVKVDSAKFSVLELLFRSDFLIYANGSLQVFKTAGCLFVHLCQGL